VPFDSSPTENQDRASHGAQALVDLADAENRIDGLFRDIKTDEVFKAYVSGEIAATEIVARLHALLGL